MSKQSVNIGTTANDGTGSPLRSAFDFINDNTDELYTLLGNGTTLAITGDVTMSGGAVTIAADAVEGSMIEDNVALAGNPTTTTQSAGDNSTKIATTAYADTAVANAIDSAPAALDTLNELAASLNDDANFAGTMTTSLAGKLATTDGAVGTSNIADDAVTADKLANSINTEIAANTAKTGITTSQANAITANTAKVTNATHTGDVTGATALTIAADAVDGTKIADDSIDSEHIVDGSVDLAHLAADSVDGSKIADDSIDSEHYVDGSIDNAHLSDDSVSFEKIDDEFTTSDALTAASTVDVDFDAAQIFTLTPTSSTTLNITNPKIGITKTVIVTGAGSSYTLSFNVGGASGTFNLIAGEYDDTSSTKNLIQIICVGSTEFWYSISQIAS